MIYVFDLISRIGMFSLILSLLYFFFKCTVFKLIKINRTVCYNMFYLDDIICVVISLMTVLLFFDIQSVYY